MKKFFYSMFLFFGILIPIVTGLWIRFDDFKFWSKNEKIYFFQGKPIFTSYDAYYFALWTKEKLKGNYKAGDPFNKKFVPDGSFYPAPIPMESWIAAKFSQILSIPIEWVAFWLTPIFAVMVVIPLYIYFHRLKLPIAGFSGALLSVVSLSYLVRTSICRFDTDSLNLFFPFTIALFLFLSLESLHKKKFFWVISAGIFSQLYYWWYLHPGLVLVLVLFYSFALWLEREIPNKEKLYLFLTFLVASNPVIIAKGIFNLISLIKNYLINYFMPEVAGFPNVQRTVVELKHLELYKLSEVAAGNFPVFALGFSGLVILFIREWRRILLLTPILFVGLSSFFGANRFIMYLSPFVGLGFGYLLERISALKNNKFFHFSLFLLAGIVILISNRISFRIIAFPVITPLEAADLWKLSSLTSQNSWIWAWWDYGNAVIYYSDRATYHDPQSFGSAKTYFVARSFVESSPSKAYNIILGVSNLGAKGIKELLKKGMTSQDIDKAILLGKYSKSINKEIYWLFTMDELRKFPAISFIGNWDFGKEEGKPFFFKVRSCKESKDFLVCGNWFINYKEKSLFLPKRRKLLKVQLKRFVIKEKSQKIKEFNLKSSFTFELIAIKNGYLGILLDEKAYKSMFNQMFVLRNYNSRYFSLIYDNFPVSVVYRIIQPRMKD